MTITSFAQNFEDVMLRRALRTVERGFYIDVGASEPDADSVTKLFYDQGWRGINIEPNPDDFALLSEHRPDDHNLGVALSDQESTLTFYVVRGTGLSSLDPKIAKTHAATGMTVTDISVPVSTLERVWDTHVPTGRDVHFLKVDVEGEEARVINGGNWTKHRPWIVVVEATAPMSPKPRHEDWEPTLLSHGYQFAYWDGLNRFYVSEEHAELLEAFQTPPNVFDDFVLYRQVLVEQQAANLADQLSGYRALQRNHTELQNTHAELQNTHAELQNTHAETLKRLAAEQQKSADQARQIRHLERPFFEKLLFRKNGRPKRPLRRLLFHSNGKPRSMFRRVILRKDGRPRRAFYDWIYSTEYQSLPKALTIFQPSGKTQLTQNPTTSPRTQYFLDRLSQTSSSNGP